MARLDEAHENTRREADFARSIRALNGRRLREVVLQIIEPEINLVFLRFEDALYALYPWRGGELLRFVAWDKEIPTELGPGAWYQPFDHAAVFHGCSVKQVRAIGGAFNGHGIEISFADALEQTLIIQSIESGDVPRGFGDCLRVGIADYTYCYERDADA